MLFLGHYFVYASVLHFFGLAAFEHRTALALILFALPLSFIASSFLAHWYDGLLTRVLYFCSSLWLGVGLTLLTAFAIGMGCLGYYPLLGRSPDLPWFGLAAVGLTLLYSAYGDLERLPPAPCALHRPHQEPPARLARQDVGANFRRASGANPGRKFLSRVVAKVNAQNPAMVLITGDLFDGSDGNLEAIGGSTQPPGCAPGDLFCDGKS
jgi:hypothetical protein